MSFTPITVQATRANADGSPASGTISFTLNAEMLNGTESIQPAPILGVLNPNGQLVAQNGQPIILLANDDDGTTPADPSAAYVVQENIVGSSNVEYAVIIPGPGEGTPFVTDTAAIFTEGSPVVQLSNVLASSAFTGLSSESEAVETSIVAYDPVSNTVTMASNAPSSQTVDDLKLWNGVDLSTLAQYEPAPVIIAYIPFNLGQTDGQVATWDADTSKWIATTPSGGGGTPSNTVVGPDDFGADSSPGSSSTYSRGDHDHGLPDAPTPTLLDVTVNSGPLIDSGLLPLAIATQPLVPPSGVLQPLPPLIGFEFTGEVDVLVTGSTRPYGICVGRDHNVYQCDSTGGPWQVTPEGVATQISLPDNGNVQWICSGADGNIWGNDTQFLGHDVGVWRISLPDLTPTFFPANSYAALCAGPDGNLWMGQSGGGVIRMAMDGTVTAFGDEADINQMCAGPDGNLWGVQQGGSGPGIWKVTTDGVQTFFSIPDAVGPYNVCTGPDGNLWFTDEDAGLVWKVTVDGDATSFTLPSGVPQGICAGAGGDLWACDVNGLLWKITVEGEITSFSVGEYQLEGICVGPDGSFWMSSYLGGGIIIMPFTVVAGKLKLTQQAYEQTLSLTYNGQTFDVPVSSLPIGWNGSGIASMLAQLTTGPTLISGLQDQYGNPLQDDLAFPAIIFVENAEIFDIIALNAYQFGNGGVITMWGTSGGAPILGFGPNGVLMPNMSTSDPHVVGQWWNNSGVVNVSAG